MTAKSRFNLDGTNAHTLTFGEEGDISSLCTYGWYEWCYFRDQTAAFPANKEVMGRVLGPARGEGNEMCQWVLKSNGRIVPMILSPTSLLLRHPIPDPWPWSIYHLDQPQS